MSAQLTNAQPLCEHIVAEAPLPDIVAVIDDHLGLTDGIVRCCRHYLLEMLDWRDNTRLFRVRHLPDAAAATYLRNLARGSCDLSRGSAETHQLTTLGEPLPGLLEVDMGSGRITNVHGTLRKPPTASWRNLPCSGVWFDRAYRDSD